MKNKILQYTAAAMSAISLLFSGCCIPMIEFEPLEFEFSMSGKTTSAPETTHEQSYSHSEYPGSSEYSVPVTSDSAVMIYDALVEGLRNEDDMIKLDTTVDFEDVSLAMNMVIWYHPELFWLSGYEAVTYRSSSEITVKYLEGTEKGTLPTMRRELDAAADRIISMIPPGSDTFEKIVFVHDYLVSNTDYDMSGAAATVTGGNGLYGTAYGCLVQGDAVCQGYALGFMYIMQKLGIDCGIIGGECDRGSHAWNYVEVNGTKYWIDVTWDDPSYGEVGDASIGTVSHSYCLVNDELLLRTRNITYDERNVPVCRSMTDNYFFRNNAYFYSYDKDAVKAVLDAGASERSAEMMFSSREVLDEAVELLLKKGDIWRICDNLSSSDTITYSIDDDMYVLKLEY